ncbi:flagellar hook-basal body complex protein FliE [Accumulibacter sp.]|uniref:flagellar hook-basal body complex protein FliE n=1 Tax=Accumulibacter sp. TaxID=2053492 RepID=UPI0025FFB7B9|nr:flagellar hook-basal body complex protein FliE [Accumulibacter sp.]MCM8596263.1 flagellar hook-basal body complex protein FliE [Accumulibacter sp.]MCM8627194.1 flagellar hook-basal body complex protein FliE [Accumulibacter sp.]MDS4050412.1 flagellar hook-basal body complex protein FliE [Accumulibacter sp.]
METKGIDQMLNVLRATSTAAANRSPEGSAVPGTAVDFAQVLQTSIDRVSQTQEQAEALAASFAAGNSGENLHEVMIALQKANLSFQEMIQVRNKLVSAYHDVMNMQV